MGEEYRRWLEAHPDATEEEQEAAWQEYLKRLEARNLVGYMLLSLRH